MFDTFFYNPIYNLMIFLSNYIPDFGVVIILTTIIVKLIIYPLYSDQIKNTIATKKAQPELKEIQKQLRNKNLDQFERRELILKMMEVNKKYGVKIFTPLLSIIFQITITFALYWIIYKGGFPKVNTEILYSFVSEPRNIIMNFLGVLDLSKVSILVAIIAGVTQYIYMNISIPDVHILNLREKTGDPREDMMKAFQVYMKYGFPIIVFALLATTFNAAIGLYWVTLNIFMILQEKSVRSDKEALRDMAEKEKEEKKKTS